MLHKIKEFVNSRVLKLIYRTIFDCHLNYTNTVWGQNKSSLDYLFIIRKNLSEMLIQMLFSLGIK